MIRATADGNARLHSCFPSASCAPGVLKSIHHFTQSLSPRRCTLLNSNGHQLFAVELLQLETCCRLTWGRGFGSSGLAL